MHKHMAMTVVIICMVATSSWIAAQDFPGNPDRGEAIYKANCLRCHGKLGDGERGRMPGTAIVQPKDFDTLESRGRTDFELLLAISNGVLFTPMHSGRGSVRRTKKCWMSFATSALWPRRGSLPELYRAEPAKRTPIRQQIQMRFSLTVPIFLL